MPKRVAYGVSLGPFGQRAFCLGEVVPFSRRQLPSVVVDSTCLIALERIDQLALDLGLGNQHAVEWISMMRSEPRQRGRAR